MPAARVQGRFAGNKAGDDVATGGECGNVAHHIADPYMAAFGCELRYRTSIRYVLRSGAANAERVNISALRGERSGAADDQRFDVAHFGVDVEVVVGRNCDFEMNRELHAGGPLRQRANNFHAGRRRFCGQGITFEKLLCLVAAKIGFDVNGITYNRRCAAIERNDSNRAFIRRHFKRKTVARVKHAAAVDGGALRGGNCGTWRNQ